MKISMIRAFRVIVVLLTILTVGGGCGKMGGLFQKEPAVEPESSRPAEGETTPSGSIEPSPAPGMELSPSEEHNYYMHTVKWPGESVSIIAAWYTGKLENWRALASANPEIDPNRIFQGNKIRIPLDMMKTQEPMPQEFVEQFVGKPEKEASPSGPGHQVEEDTDLKLFGPKQ